MKLCLCLLIWLSVFVSPAFAQSNAANSLTSSHSDLAMGHKTFGMHLPQAPWKLHELEAVEDIIGKDVSLVHWFGSWDYDFEAAPFENILASGRTPLFTWQAINQPLKQIIQGHYDDYLKAYAQGLKQLNGDVYIRLLPEMNGFWEPWNGDPEAFIKAWKHIADVIKDEGAINVKWMWAPNITDNPTNPENHLERYYPGDSYVDILGLSGYNWGVIQENTAWTSFEKIYETPYERLTQLSQKPIWIAEIASAEKGGDKSIWMTEMLSNSSYPRIEAFVWFQENKEADWRINSSPETLTAFRQWHTESNTE